MMPIASVVIIAIAAFMLGFGLAYYLRR